MPVNLYDYYHKPRNRKPKRDMYGLRSRFDRPEELETPGLYNLGGRREGVGAPVLPATGIPPEPSAEAIAAPSTVSLLETLGRAPTPASVAPAIGALPSEGVPTMPITGAMPTATGKTPLLDYWKTPVAGKMPLDQFVSMAGMLAGALAPETPMGRAGAGMAGMAMPIYRERVAREAEAAAKVPTAWETYYKENIGKLTSTDLITGWHKLKTAEKDPTFDLMTRQDPITKEWQKGYQKKGTTEFLPIAAATPAEIKKAEGVEKPKKYYSAIVDGKKMRMEETPENIAKYAEWTKPTYKFMTDRKGAVSVYEGPKLITGTGKGKGEKPVDMTKIADFLYKMQYDKDGQRFEKIDPSDLVAIRAVLKDTDYEIVDTAELGEKRSLFGIDWLWPDKPPGESAYVLQEKLLGARPLEVSTEPPVAPAEAVGAEPTAPKATRILRNKKTGEVVYLDSQGNVIKREKEGTTRFPIKTD